MTRADRELLLSLHAKVDFLIARGGPQVDRFDQALIDALHAEFATDQFTRRGVLERAAIASALSRALLDADVDTSATLDEASHWPGMYFVVSGAAVSRSACTFRTTTADGSSCPRT